MAITPSRFIAEERGREIARALTDWRKISEMDAGTPQRQSSPRYWNERHGYWAFFGRTKANTALGWRYWNAFGIRPGDTNTTMAVEINPPQSGIAAGTQGLIARDSDDKRWILHGGRIHVGRDRVNGDRFAQMSGLKTVTVVFSDKSEREYFLVAPLDRDVEALHVALRSFVATCARVRSHILYGTEDAELEDRIDLGEGQSSEEKRGDYVVPPRGKIIAKRVHADIWHALVKSLDRMKVSHTNARVGRWGPDLRTRGLKPVLFEIKTDTSARAIYEALGQLVLYEELLGKRHRKVLILPGPVSTTFAPILAKINISILEAHNNRRSYYFSSVLDDLVR